MKTHAMMMTVVICLGTAAPAQDAPADGAGLIEQGARLLMRGLMAQIAPPLDDLRTALDAFGAEFGAFMDQLDDPRYYSAPEFLPNGDIILRRKPDAPIWVPPPGAGEIEL